ncbi:MULTISPECIES: lysoplasmalogenase [Flavobacterium]|uniref:Lysoplasmalogenase n=2 Tax=Flavobacterium TaxID=237 RepID=A0A2N9PCY8_9FLAO|nr:MULTISPECIES: lysoplasmalogenase [Flavobacterium]QYS89316.1 lysoplasmalogenase [Flavobacterium davisii]RVU90520.1 lysoplasmalogenase [Flavobacterium columnare]SPE78215.1 YhhN-like protein [Flavobacterium columnare]
MSKYLKIFTGISIFYLILLLTKQDALAWYFKPLLLPFLVLETYKSNDFRTKNLLLSALFFSWIGDVVLMFAHKDELFFILGLVSFLISHILFILLFTKQNQTKANSNFFWIGFIFVILYLFEILHFLFPYLGGLKIPVTIYASTISIMLLMAIKGYFNWSKPNNLTILIGALFFVSSDSILAINKFYPELELPKSGFLIMITYITAQFLITKGILELNKKK